MSCSSQRQVSRKVFYDLVSCLASPHIPLHPQKPSSLFSLAAFCALSLYSASSLILSFISSFPTTETYSISVYSFPFPCLSSLATVDTRLCVLLLGLVNGTFAAAFFHFYFRYFYFFLEKKKTNLMCEVFMPILLRAHCSCYPY